MKFGMFQLVSGWPSGTQREIYERNLEFVLLADELGFDGAWIAEHHATDYGLVPNTLQYLTLAAAKTTQVRLGAGVVVTPIHNPIRVVEEAAFLDQVSGGRVDLGVGRGYQPTEFEAFGRSLDDSREIFEDSIKFIEHAWSTEESFDWDGPAHKGKGIKITPRPLQDNPKLWHAAVSKSTFENAGKKGWQILTSPNFTRIPIVRENFSAYAKALADNGHDRTNFNFPIAQMCYAAESDTAGYEEPQEATVAYFKKLSMLLPSHIRDGAAVDEGGKDYEQFRKTQRKAAEMRFDYLWDEKSVAYGSPQRVIEHIRHLEEEVGLDYFMGIFNFGTLDHEKSKESMRRFAAEVMPAFDRG